MVLSLHLPILIYDLKDGKTVATSTALFPTDLPYRFLQVSSEMNVYINKML
jgi:hypothetical protein